MAKSRLGIFLMMLMVSSIFLFGTIHLGEAQTGTNINGIISSDTTWTQANSPFSFSGPVAVNAGVTLTIQAGVTVNLNANYLQVNGKLVAIGTSINKIQFNGGSITFTPLSSGWNEQTNSGSIIQYAIFSLTPVIVQSPAKIDHNTLNGDISMSNIISANCGVISNNTITATYGDGISCSGNASICDNTISGALWGGIDAFSGSPTIQRNLVTNNMGWSGVMSQGGIVVRNGGSGNVPTTPLIENNTVTNNNLGITIGSQGGQAISPIIQNNNVYGNQKYNFYLNQITFNVNVSNNWWGTTDTQAISQTIYDSKNNFNLGTVTFSPFLTSPNTQAPTFINATTAASGSIVPNGIIKVDYGSSQTFNISPNSGYQILDVKVNETSVGTVSSYTIQNIQGAIAISATFAPNPTPTPSPTPSPAPTAQPTANPTQTTNPTTTPAPNNNLQVTQPANATPSPSPAVPEFPIWIVLFLVIGATLSLIAIRKTKHSLTTLKGRF